MHMQVVQPNSEAEWLELRTHDVTSSEVSALFGCCPYLTEFELWHRKKNGKVVMLQENEDMEWGKALESVIAHKVAAKEGWAIRPMKEYIRIPALKIGSSFDFKVQDEEDELDGDRILEIKNVNQFAFKDGWIIHEDKTIEAPPHIEFQVQHQMLVSGVGRATIAALVGGSRPVLLHRTYDEKVGMAITRKVSAFWQSIERNEPPAPNFVKDAEFIFDMYGNADAGKVLNAHDDHDLLLMASEFRRATEERDRAQEEREALKAKILMHIGDASKVQGEGWSLSAGMVPGGPVSYVRKDYRNFKLTFKKEKK